MELPTVTCSKVAWTQAVIWALVPFPPMGPVMAPSPLPPPDEMK